MLRIRESKSPNPVSRKLDVAGSPPARSRLADGGMSVASSTSRASAPSMSTAALLLHDDEPTLALVRSLVESAGFQTGAVASAYRLQMIDSPAPPAFVVLGMTAIDDRDMDLVAYLRRR
jgi:hypothetical protein